MIELIDLVRIMKMIGCNIIQKIIQIIEFDPTLQPTQISNMLTHH